MLAMPRGRSDIRGIDLGGSRSRIAPKFELPFLAEGVHFSWKSMTPKYLRFRLRKKLGGRLGNGNKSASFNPQLSHILGRSSPTRNRQYPTEPDTLRHMVGTNASSNRQRLDSWKEIAAFFGRDERTVNRWEKELGLPVHRLPGTKGRVYAYTDELSDWLAASRNVEAASAKRDSTLRPDAEVPGARLTVITGGNPSDATSPVTTQAVTPGLPVGNSVGRPLSRGWLAVAALLIVLIACALVLIRRVNTHNSQFGKGRNAATTLPGESRGVVQASSPAHNAEAEQLYLKGRYYWNKRTPEDLNRAVDYFTQAIVHDPGYASAYVGLADCYNLLREYTAMPAAEAYPRALAAAKKAVELDDRSSAAHASLAFVLFYGKWDVANAEAEFRRAIDLDSNNAVAHHWYANYLMTLHRLPESVTEIERAQALDPSSASILADKANILIQAGRPEEGISLLKQMEVTEPAFRSPHLYLKYYYLDTADYSDFLTESKKDAVLLHDHSALAIATAAEKGFAAGGANALFESMLRAQKKYYAQRLVSPVAVAQTCADLGKKDEALQYLKAAYDQHDGLLLSLKDYRALDILHGEPAYRDLLMKMNLPAEN
jgi:Tfp pilus assembly protein PilF